MSFKSVTWKVDCCLYLDAFLPASANSNGRARTCIPYDEEFLKKIDVAHSECMNKYNSEEMVKLRKLVELFR